MALGQPGRVAGPSALLASTRTSQAGSSVPRRELEKPGLTALTEAGCSYALLADGTTITIRPAGAGDYEAVKQLHEAMSPDNLYLRFFSMSRQAAEQEARRVSRDSGSPPRPPDHSPPDHRPPDPPPPDQSPPDNSRPGYGQLDHGPPDRSRPGHGALL